MGVRYQERPSLRGAGRTAVVFALFLAWVYVPHLSEVRAADLWLIPAFGLVAAPFAAVSLSKRRYHSITLTDQWLTVGRVRMPATGVSADDGPAPAGTPLLCGAYAAPMGWRKVVVTGPDGRPWRVATKQPEQLLAALRPC